MNQEPQEQLNQTAQYLDMARRIRQQASYLKRTRLHPLEAHRLFALAEYFSRRYELSVFLDELCGGKFCE